MSTAPPGLRASGEQDAARGHLLGQPGQVSRPGRIDDVVGLQVGQVEHMKKSGHVVRVTGVIAQSHPLHGVNVPPGGIGYAVATMESVPPIKLSIDRNDADWGGSPVSSDAGTVLIANRGGEIASG